MTSDARNYTESHAPKFYPKTVSTAGENLPNTHRLSWCVDRFMAFDRNSTYPARTDSYFKILLALLTMEE